MNRPDEDELDDLDDARAARPESARAQTRDIRDVRAKNPPYQIESMDSTEFARMRIRKHWLIEYVAVTDQPVVIGGGVMTLKTSMAIDLAVSLGTGKSFLRTFPVPQPRRVAFFSGERGLATMRETASRISDSKGVRLTDCNVLWSTELPTVTCPEGCDALRSYIHHAGIEVAVFDPLYLLLADQGALATNVFEMGFFLDRLCGACLSGGATPILVHNMTKYANYYGQDEAPRPLDLVNLAYAGVPEYVRQWILLSRPTRYKVGTGFHELYMDIGGNHGHGGRWRLDINEGIPAGDLTGRKWDVRVHLENPIKRRSRTRPEAAPRAGKQSRATPKGTVIDGIPE